MNGQNNLRQGDIVIAKLDPTIGHEQSKTRPCVIIQCNMLNQYAGTTILAPITSKTMNKNYPNIVSISSKNANLTETGRIKVEQSRCVDTSRIIKRIGFVSNQELDSIKEALKVVFDLY